MSIDFTMRGELTPPELLKKERKPIKKVERKLFEPGWYKDIPNEVYHKSGGVSSSTLKKFLCKTPAHIDYEKKHPKEPTKNMQLGTAVHSLVLEPEKAKDEIAVMPGFNLRTKLGRADRDDFIEDNRGKVILTGSEWKQAQDMAGSLLAFIEKDEVLRLVFENYIAESSVYWWYRSNDPDDGTEYKQMCKVRPDILCTEYPVLGDIKTSQDATYTGFQKSIINFDYHVSAAMYLEGVNQNREIIEGLCNSSVGEYRYDRFIFLVVENEPPYLSAVYELDKNAIELGKQLYTRAMLLHYEARRDDWPAFTSDVRLMELPGWASRAHIV